MMTQSIKEISIDNFKSYKGTFFESIKLTYQTFGQPLGKAEIVLINHALTGNSEVAGEQGWWNSLVGVNKVINLNDYTVIAFDIPNNNYKIEHTDIQYDDLMVVDIAKLFVQSLKQLNIEKIFACVGSSLGGCIAWEIAVQYPDFVQNIFPIASDWKATDWIIAQCGIQNNLLDNSCKPIEDARMMAMLFYRTPESFTSKFNRSKCEKQNISNVMSWLNHHGNKLRERFALKSYKTMNYLLSSADITHGEDNFEEIATRIKANVYQIAVHSDLLFTASENRLNHQILKRKSVHSKYYEMRSIHGHDAFLIEYKQLNIILKHVFVRRFVI
ncbi:MAG: alpha/beta fold hydrolase [Flavobacteriales bacterium]